MLPTNLDRFPFSGALDLFGIGKSALHDRLNALGIRTTKVGRNSFIEREDLLKLIELDRFLKEDKTRKIAQFLNQSDIEKRPADALDVSTAPIKTRPVDVSDLSGGSFEEFVALVQAIASMLGTDPLANYKALALAAEEEWLLPSKKVRELIGIKPKGENFRRGSWLFVRHGKIGNEAAWLVVKIQLQLPQ